MVHRRAGGKAQRLQPKTVSREDGCIRHLRALHDQPPTLDCSRPDARRGYWLFIL